MVALREKTFGGWTCDCGEYPHAPIYCGRRRPIVTTITVDDDFRVPALTKKQVEYRAAKDRKRGHGSGGSVSEGGALDSPDAGVAEPSQREPIVACRLAAASELPPDAGRWLAALWRLRRPAVATYAKGWATKRFAYPPGTKDPKTGKTMHWHDDPWPIESVALRAPGLLVACWTRLEGEAKWSPSTRMAVWKGRIYRVSVVEAGRLIASLK